MNFPLLPGSTIGILGSGQLGRMLTIAAKQLGYRVAIYSPDADTPAGQVADVEAVGDYLAGKMPTVPLEQVMAEAMARLR